MITKSQKITKYTLLELKMLGTTRIARTTIIPKGKHLLNQFANNPARCCNTGSQTNWIFTFLTHAIRTNRVYQNVNISVCLLYEINKSNEVKPLGTN